MNQITIVADTSDVKQVRALAAYFSILAGNEVHAAQPVKEEPKTEPVKKTRTKKATDPKQEGKKTEPVPEPTPPPAGEAENENPEDRKDTATEVLTFDDVKLRVSSFTRGNKERQQALKAWLTDKGVPNVPQLPEELWPEIMAHVDELESAE